MIRVKLLPTGPRQFFLRHAAHRGDLFQVFWGGTGAAPSTPDFFLLRGVDSFGTTAESLRELAQDEASAKLLAGGCSLLLDCSSEGPALSSEHLFQIHLALQQLKIRPSKVVFLHQNARLPADYAGWIRKQPGFAPIRLFDYHFYLQDAVIRRHAEPVGLGTLRGIVNRSAAAGTKKYICLNNRSKEHRLVILGHLARQGLLRDGVVSFRLGRYGQDSFDVDAVLPRAAGAFPGFAADLDAFRALRPSLPLVAEEAPPSDDIAIDHGFDLHRRAFLALVAESEMRPDVVRFTEKSIKPLLHGMPFIVAGNRGTLAALRALGFQTFAPLIDESYDEIEDAGLRLAACLEEFDRLARLDTPALEAIFARLWPVCAHNMDHFAHGLLHRSLDRERDLMRMLRDSLAG